MSLKFIKELFFNIHKINASRILVGAWQLTRQFNLYPVISFLPLFQASYVHGTLLESIQVPRSQRVAFVSPMFPGLEPNGIFILWESCLPSLVSLAKNRTDTKQAARLALQSISAPRSPYFFITFPSHRYVSRRFRMISHFASGSKIGLPFATR